jgi:hypothetical protein
MVLIFFYGPQYTEFCRLDALTIPIRQGAKLQNTDYKTGKYVIVNNFKMQTKIVTIIKTILPRMWSSDHVENCMNFTMLLS